MSGYFNRHKRPLFFEMTALVDVVFMLLIFLLVTARYANERYYDVSLPEALGALVHEQEQQLVVTIHRSGAVTINDTNIVTGRVEDIMQALVDAEISAGETLLIRADGDTKHQRVVAVMDAASRLGAEKVRLVHVERL